MLWLGYARLAAGMQIVFEVGDRLLVGQDRFPNYVIDADDATERIVLEYRQVADIPVGHQLHAEFHGIVGCNRGKVCGHDLRHGGVGGGFTQQDHFPGVVSFRHNPEVLVPLHYQYRPDVLICHHPQRFQDSGVGGDRLDPSFSFMSEKMRNFFHIA